MQNKTKQLKKNVSNGHIRRDPETGNNPVPVGEQPQADGEVKLQEPKLQKDKNRPRVTFSRNELTFFDSAYNFQEEGEAALRGFYHNLFAERDGARPKFRLDKYQSHPHPVGATMRAMLGDYVYYNYETVAEILDIGSSISRLSTRYDFNGNKLYQRVHATAPILSSRDVIRQREHMDDFGVLEMSEGVHYCRCVGGKDNSRFHTTDKEKLCKVCYTPQKVTMSVDSAYYPGVIEEQAYHAVMTQGRAYLVFNDYDGARLKNGNHGFACDKESEYFIEGSQVKSIVKGNFAPYEHSILSTEGLDAWQYHLYVGGKDVICLFQVLQRFWNKDIPYILVKMFAMESSEFEKFGEENFTGVKLLNKYYDGGATRLKGTPTKVKTDAKVVEKYADYKKLFDKQPDECINLADGGIHFKESFQDCKLKIGQYTLDFNKREEDIYSRVDELISWFRKSPMKIYITKTSDKDLYVNLELKHSEWFTLGLNFYYQTYSAPLALVVEAYDLLGQRAELKSIMFAVSQLQRRIYEKTNQMNFDCYEAMSLAWAIRDQQISRFEALQASCPAIRK